jgi:hypothetical protein
MDDIMVAESPRTTDIFAVAENMRESFEHIIATAAALTAGAKSARSI